MSELTEGTFELNDDEIDALNVARNALAAIEKRARDAVWNQTGDHDGWTEEYRRRSACWQAAGLGALAEAADTAGDTIFGVLNVASSRCGLPLTDEQLFNRTDDPVEEEAPS